MTTRHMLLAAGAILLAGLGIYLFFEVRQAPAQPPAAKSRPAPEQVESTSDHPAAATQPVRPQRGPQVGNELRPFGDGVKRAPPDLGVPGAPADIAKANPKVDSLMDEANKAYDRGEFDEARALAVKVLATSPTNARMLRILVSAACIDGDAAEAQKQYNRLPPSDRAQMKIRCDRYGVTFTDPPAQ